jgi:hypothetical protein
MNHFEKTHASLNCREAILAGGFVHRASFKGVIELASSTKEDLRSKGAADVRLSGMLRDESFLRR